MNADISEIGGHTKERLKELQALPLERKVGFTAARIVEWHNHYQGKVYVSFSGGKDSTVLLYLVRSLFQDVKAVFVDTGLEYPEIKEFVKTFDNVEILRPKMSFKEVIEKYGWPVISKQIANNVCYANPGTTRLSKLKGEFDTTIFNCKTYEYLLDAPFKISDKCCTVMKKSPFKLYGKVSGIHPIIATMATESALRKTQWIKNGCNAFNTKTPTSTPMSFWTEQDVLSFIKLKNIPIAPVYGDTMLQDGKYSTTGCSRTGCVFCLFGAHSESEPNRIQRLALTHPELYFYCMNKLGMRQVMDYIKIPYIPQKNLTTAVVAREHCNDNIWDRIKKELV